MYISVIVRLPEVGGLSLGREGVVLSRWHGADVAFRGALPLLDLVHRAHDGLVDFIADLFNLALAVQSTSDRLVCLNELLELSRQLKVLLVEERDVALEGLDFVLELVLVFDLLAVHEFEVLDLSLERGDLVLAELVGDAAIVVKVGELLPAEELLVVHLREGVLGLEVLMVQALQVLDLAVQLLKGGLRGVKQVGLLAYLHCDGSEIIVFLLARIRKHADAALGLVELALELVDSQLEATDVQISRTNRLLETLNVAKVLVRQASRLSQVSLQTFDLPALAKVAVLHDPDFLSELVIVVVLSGKGGVGVLNVHNESLLLGLSKLILISNE